jgi:hypothetical protein
MSITLAPRSHRSARRAALAAALLAGVTGCARRAPAPVSAPVVSRITSGETLLAAMHDRYAGKWYRTLTFVQRTTQVPPQGGPDRVSTWHETMMLPGRLRIDTDLKAGNGTLYANDSQYVVVNNARRRAVAGHNPLLVLGFDVYGQPPARTAELLRDLGFPMTPVREGTWQDRPVWVVGGRGASDLHSPQIWVDKERLLFVRLLQPFVGDTTKTQDVRFGNYVPAAGGWVAATVEALVDGKRVLLEEYDDIRTDRTVSETLFDPTKWGTAPHWAKAR